MPEITKPQVRVGVSDGTLGRTLRPKQATKFRDMRKHPTIALGRRLVRAPVVVSQWSVEGNDKAPPDAIDFIDREMQPWRTLITGNAMFAMIDVGWIAFEKVLTVRRETMRLGYEKFKPLIQDVTDILVDENTGAFRGVQQEVENKKVQLSPQQCMCISFDVEGTDWYGTPRMQNVERPYDDWNRIAGANDRYDAKLAGANWAVYYPPGKSPFNGQDEVDNFEIAKTILAALEASGGVVVPNTVEGMIDDLSKEGVRAWRIEVLESSTGVQGAFVERMKYLDTLMIRGLGLPERSVLEGQFGTKAEAGAHADFAITDIELTHQYICEQVNTGAVDDLLRMNFGPQAVGTVKIVPSPLSDAEKKWLRDLYLALISASPELLAIESASIDMDALRDSIDVPFQPGTSILLPGMPGILPTTQPGLLPAPNPAPAPAPKPVGVV